MPLEEPPLDTGHASPATSEDGVEPTTAMGVQGDSPSQVEPVTGNIENADEAPDRLPSDKPSYCSAELSDVTDRLAELHAQAREANRIADHRERSMDRMHDELVALRAGELLQAMMPVLRDLVRLCDDLERAYSTYSDRGESAAARDFGLFRDTVLDVLYRQGVEPYSAHPGDHFEPKTQRALAAVPTGDQARDRTIARVVRTGFRGETKLVRMMEVEVHRHDPGIAPGAADTPTKSES